MIRAACLALLLAGSAAAQEYVVTAGRLSNDDFYNLVACSAPPGGPCGEEIVRWPAADARDLTFAIAPATPGYPKWLRSAIVDSVDRAVAALSDVTPAVQLRRVAKAREADVVIYPQNIRDGDVMLPLPRPEVAGLRIGAAHVHVWWNGRREITDALIVLASDIPPDEVYPIVLEEMTQSLGLLTDIKNPFYDYSSVFSEDSNAVTRLGAQDIMAIRRHYAP